ncbi:MAG: glycoside hydrolase family 97 protein, partial [Limisphaerales bacterium]
MFSVHRIYLAAAVFAVTVNANGAEMVRSPDGNVRVTVESPVHGHDVPGWSLSFHGKVLFTNCDLSLRIAGDGDWFRNSRLIGKRTAKHSKIIPVHFGKSSSTQNHYEELRLNFISTAGHKIDAVFRCYNDAVAFRYEVPQQGTNAHIVIADEGTSFDVTGNPTAYIQVLENFRTSHEHLVTTTRYDDIKRGALLDTPLTLSWDDGVVAAITEAALRRYAGMSLTKTQSVLRCALSPWPDGTKVKTSLPMRSPWRVVLVGKGPGDLLESNTIYCLNDPPAIGDLSWIRPGKMTWTWWNGYLYEDHRTAPIFSLEMQKRYIDFCAANRILYHDVVADENDKPWYFQSSTNLLPSADADVTQVRVDLDLPAIRAYAKSKGVRLWTWVWQSTLRGKVEPAFAAFEKMGWSGMMVDFFDHDDQETVEFAEEILRAAARHHILIHFHGMYKITGWQRTYPNLMNHEGARNLEWLKFTDSCPPEHTLLMALTRLVAGPMDYHLGGFRSVPRSQFKPHMVAPNVLGTRCFNLALYVCTDNPNPMVADYPSAYLGQPGFDFLKTVPTYWDETRVLDAKIGELLVTARRKGKVWYIGGIGAKTVHAVDVPLSFLRKGRFSMRLWKDSPKVADDPNLLVTET